MKIVFIATQWNQMFENFLRTLRKFEYSFKQLGKNQKNFNFKLKSQLVHEYLCKEKTPDDEVYAIIDAYDILANRHSEDLKKSFLKFKKPLLVGSEWYCGNIKNCKHINAYWELQKYTPAKKYANSGFVLGYKSSLKELYKHMLNFEDDQMGLITYINTYPEKFAVDHNNYIVQHTHILDITMNEPFFYHFPGPLLKKGLFPQYNNMVRKILDIKGYYVYPNEQIYVFAFMFIFLLLFIFYKYK